MSEASFVKFADVLRAALENYCCSTLAGEKIKCYDSTCPRTPLVFPTQGHKGIGAAFACMLTQTQTLGRH